MIDSTGDKEATIVTWNVQSGGFNKYDPSLQMPERESLIQATIESFHIDSGVDTVSLTDTYRWDEVYGGESGIARHLGFKAARFTRLHDERLERNNGAGVGIAFATDKAIEQSMPLDLGTRLGLGVILGIGNHGLQIANVYLDDFSEDARLQQTRALLSSLEPDLPTVIVGDFNSLRPSMAGSSAGVKARDLMVRSMAFVMPKSTYLGKSIRGMNRREVVRLIESNGYKDAGLQQKEPTTPAKLPLFGVDFAFHNDSVAIKDFRIIQNTNASNHRPILVSVETT